MKKIIIMLLSILVLVVGVYSIIKVLKLDDSFDEVDDIVDNYVLYNSGVNHVNYTFNEIDFKDTMIQIDDKTIYFNDNTLYVGINEIGKVSDIYSNFAIYDNRILVMFFKDSNYMYNVLEYDYYASSYNLMSNIDGYNIDMDESNFFEDKGYSINLTLEKNDKYYYNGEEIDLCTYKNKKLIVKKSLEMLYNNESREFDAQEEFDSLDLNSYKESYGLC